MPLFIVRQAAVNDGIKFPVQDSWEAQYKGPNLLRSGPVCCIQDWVTTACWDLSLSFWSSGSWSHWKTKACWWSCRVNIMAVDALATEGARASADMVLTQFSRNIPAKWPTLLQTTFLNAIYQIKIKFHRCFSLRVKMTISQRWFSDNVLAPNPSQAITWINSDYSYMTLYGVTGNEITCMLRKLGFQITYAIT